MSGIIVLGGSFNPPTKAHKIILEEVMKQTNAEIGLFVPSSDNYVKRKMSRTGGKVFSESERLMMLSGICSESEYNLLVDTVEYQDDGRGHTYRTLCEIQEKYPGERIYLIVGEDKLGVLPRWHDIESLLSKFYIIITKRSTGQDQKPVTSKIKENPILNKYKDRMTIVELDDEIADISSTKARELLAQHSANTSSVLCDCTIRLLKSLMRA